MKQFKLLLSTLGLLILGTVIAPVNAYGQSINSQTPTVYATGINTSGYIDGMAFDSKGNLYVIDNSVGVYKIPPGGGVATLWQNTSLMYAIGVCYYNDYLYFTVANLDDGVGYLYKVSSSTGVVSMLYSGFPYNVGGITVDSNGNLWLVADTNNGIVCEMDPTGTSIANTITLPAARRLAFDSLGNLYVPGSIYNTIFKVNPTNGSYVDTGITGLDQPVGIQFDSSGNLYIANNGLLQLLKVQSGGITPIIIASSVRFADLAFDSNGNLYACDRNTGDVMKFTPGFGADIATVPQTKTLKAWAQDGTLHIDGLTAGQSWSVYNLSGSLVQHGVAGNDQANISLSVHGVYIVQSGSNRVKVIYY